MTSTRIKLSKQMFLAVILGNIVNGIESIGMEMDARVQEVVGLLWN